MSPQHALSAATPTGCDDDHNPDQLAREAKWRADDLEERFLEDELMTERVLQERTATSETPRTSPEEQP